MIAPELRAWLDGLRHGHAVVVETSAGLHEGEVVERTASGRIRVRWSGGLDLFYGTDVELAGQRVGARASKAFARIRAAGPRLRPIHTADDLAAIALVAGTDPAALARALDRLPADPATGEHVDQHGHLVRLEPPDAAEKGGAP